MRKERPRASATQGVPIMNAEIRELDDAELATVSAAADPSIAVATWWIMETVRIAQAHVERLQGCCNHS